MFQHLSQLRTTFTLPRFLELTLAHLFGPRGKGQRSFTSQHTDLGWKRRRQTSVNGFDGRCPNFVFGVS